MIAQYFVDLDQAIDRHQWAVAADVYHYHGIPWGIAFIAAAAILAIGLITGWFLHDWTTHDTKEH